MAGTFQEKFLFIFSDTDRAMLTETPEDTRTHCLIISSRKIPMRKVPSEQVRMPLHSILKSPRRIPFA
ncbi:hypothetical protein STEG23_024828 [Scotinomys teguina]